jgi:hypothetical protein
MYDIIFIGNKEDDSFIKLKERFPLIKSAKDFEDAKRKSFTKFFWVIWNDLIINDDFNFDYEVSEWDKEYVHIFRNANFFDGLCLFPKLKNLSKREIDYRFFTNKKEIDILASTPKPFDIIFISYNESTADQNYENLKIRFPRIKRIHGVKGIHQAHIEAAKLATTKMFWVVDADAIILDTFKFDYNVPVWDLDVVHVWRSRNPINNLEYGYGGVKLLPTQLTMNMRTDTVDMTMSISSKFKAVEEVSNITAFNTDPFSTWRSAFRECCKLAVINNEESLARLYFWMQLNTYVQHGGYAYIGAIAGKMYGEKNASNPKALAKINDFTWLKDRWLAEKPELLL